MLENIKLLLGIEADDSSKDKLIFYYIEVCTQAILNLIKRDELPPELLYCVERKVVQLIQGGYDGQRVTQIDRGDYKVKYEFDGSSNKNLFSDMMGELRPFMRKVRFY